MKLCFYFTGSIDKSTRDIELQMFGHEQMLDGSSSDVIKQLSEVTVRDEAEVETTSTTQVITCDVLFVSGMPVYITAFWFAEKAEFRVSCLK